jgi:drug/metabolite transporter (DMT)-like permease
VVFAALAMIPTYLLCSRLPAFAEAVRIRERGLSLKDLWTFFYLGFFGVAINQMCFTIGLSYTSVSHAAVIVGLQPVYTLVLAVLLRIETATLQRALGMGMALAGVAILASEKGISSHSPSLLGDAVTMAGSLGFAMYAVLGKKIAGRYDSLTMTAFNHFAGALIVMPIALHQAIRLTSSLRHDPVPCLGGAAVHGCVQLGSGLRALFLVAALSSSLATRRIYLSPARTSDVAWYPLAWRARFRVADTGRSACARGRVSGGVRERVQNGASSMMP